jgi:hypothetical protein
MAFSIAGAGAMARGYNRGIDMRLDRERLEGIEGRAQERHGIDMAEADYRSRARAPADAVRGDAERGIDYRSGRRSYEEGTRKPLAAVQARHVLDDERASNAEARAQEAAKRAQAQEGRAAQSHAYNLAAQVSPDKKRRAQELSIEMGELDAELQRELAPLRAAGDKQEAMNRIMASRQQTYETFAKTFYELGPEAVVSAFNAWPGSKVTDAVAFRQVQTPQGPVHALVDADGKVLDDPTTGQPAQLTEKELKGLYASAQARNAVKGKRNVVKAKDADGNEALVDADTGQLIGSMQLDEQDNPKWVPAGEGGQAPPPKPTGAPRPAIGEGPQPPKEAIDVLMAAMRGSDMEDRTAARKEFDEEFGPGTAALWIGRAQQEQQTQEQRQQQEARRQQEQQQEQARREREQQLAVQQAKSLLKVVDGPGIAPRGPDEPASEADAQFVEFFEANRDKLSQADRGMMLEMLPAYRNAKARLANAPKGIDPAVQGRDDWLGGIGAPSVPGVVFGRPPVPR